MYPDNHFRGTKPEQERTVHYEMRNYRRHIFYNVFFKWYEFNKFYDWTK
jgi:hypothetical protein